MKNLFRSPVKILLLVLFSACLSMLAGPLPATAATTSAPIASTASTQTVTAAWVAPTTREDGSPLAASAIDHYTVYYAVGAVPTTGSLSVNVTQGNTATISLTLAPSAKPQDVEVAVTVTDTSGLESPLSNVASKSFLVQSQSGPSAPTSVTFSVTCGSGCTITAQ